MRADAETASIEADGRRGPVRLTVVFDNVPRVDRLETSWGLACLVELSGRTILFDTGGDGRILLANMEHLGLDPATVDIVLLSHLHADHTGGLEAFLRRHPRLTVCLPVSFPRSFRSGVEGRGARVETIEGPRCLLAGVHSTGELGSRIKEQSLLVESSEGPIVVTGCAHPGIVEIVRSAGRQLGASVRLVVGGLHLHRCTTEEIGEVIRALEEEGVRKVAPGHCTGEEATALFRDAWGDGFIAGGCGAVIDLPRREG